MSILAKNEYIKFFIEVIDLIQENLSDRNNQQNYQIKFNN